MSTLSVLSFFVQEENDLYRRLEDLRRKEQLLIAREAPGHLVYQMCIHVLGIYTSVCIYIYTTVRTKQVYMTFLKEICTVIILIEQ